MTELPAPLREELARWLFERDYREQSLCSAYDARWDDWVERNQEEWREEADLVWEFLQYLLDKYRAEVAPWTEDMALREAADDDRNKGN